MLICCVVWCRVLLFLILMRCFVLSRHVFEIQRDRDVAEKTVQVQVKGQVPAKVIGKKVKR